MKAIVQSTYGPPDVLGLGDIDRPAPGPDEVLLRVHAAGVDPGVWHLTAGLPYLIRVMGFGFRAPKTRLRADVAGTVEAIGANVTEFKPGDEVFGICDGAYAEYACVPVDKCVPKPANISFEQAAAVAVSGCTALHALRDQGQVQAGQRVLIIGAGGGIGTFAVQLAKAFGAHVTGVCSTSKVDLVRSVGADEVIDYTRDDLGDGKHRYDLILDTAGLRSLSRLRRVLAPKGTLVIVGGEGGGRWLGGLGRTLWALMLAPFVGQRLRGLFSVERRDDLQVLAELIEAGKLTPVVGRTYKLSEVPDAVRYIHEQHARGKVVIAL